MQPQTLQIATWLLYINGFFALSNFVDSRMEVGYIRRFYTFGLVYGLVVIAVHVLGGLLMANERKIGYKMAIVAAFWGIWHAISGIIVATLMSRSKAAR